MQRLICSLLLILAPLVTMARTEYPIHDDFREAVALIDHRFETESSGGITFDTIRSYAECGVDYVSVGALTHSVKGLDMSFKAC